MPPSLASETPLAELMTPSVRSPKPPTEAVVANVKAPEREAAVELLFHSAPVF